MKSDSLEVNEHISIPEDELEERFLRASGPGGQNVNRVATAVQLRFDVASSASLPEAVKERLMKLAGNRISSEGVLVIEARRYRNQDRNRQDARQRLIAWIRRAAQEPKRRRATRPSERQRQQRLQEKREQAEKKRLRRPPAESD